ncbi:MAG: hypothetical protein RLZZ369_1883, partial [Pseudomonadota bacterium]
MNTTVHTSSAATNRLPDQAPASAR